MAITGSVRRASVAHDDATQDAAHVRRSLRLLVLAALGVALGSFGLMTVAYLLDPRAIHDVAGFAAAWWGSVIAALVLGVAACVCDNDGCEDGRYLGAIVDGLREEWRRRS